MPKLPYRRNCTELLGEHPLVHTEVKVDFLLRDRLNEYVELAGRRPMTVAIAASSCGAHTRSSTIVVPILMSYAFS